MFGVANLRTFTHIGVTIEKNHVVDEKGKDVYLPNIARLKIPIVFIQGAENELFLPAGTHQTFRYLAEKNGPENYMHMMFPRYAHMDIFVGKDAATDVYPNLLLELDKYN
jgi:cholesterol oxidase